MLHTERLLLRPPTEADLAHFLAMRRDEEAMRHLGGPMGDEAAARQFAYLRTAWMLGRPSLFCVTRRSSGAWIGLVGPWSLAGIEGEEFRWEIVRAQRRRGLGFEAAAVALDWLFDVAKRRETHARIGSRNTASLNLATRLGAQPVEVLQTSQASSCLTYVLRSENRAWAPRPRGSELSRDPQSAMPEGGPRRSCLADLER